MTVAAPDVYTVDGGEEKLCATAFVSMRNVQRRAASVAVLGTCCRYSTRSGHAATST
jgi:hypothetical protein